MRLGCPKCGALYEIDEGAIPASGREVHCTACDHRWFQHPGTPAAPPAPDRDEVPEPAAPGPAPDARAAEPPRPRPTDPAVLQILREEASREMEARRRDASPASEPAQSPPAEPEIAPQPRRALLPEIDESNPAPGATGPQPGAGTIILHAKEEPARGGFAAGFAAALLLGLLAAAAYRWSGELSAAVPALAEPLGVYVAAIDTLRGMIRTPAG